MANLWDRNTNDNAILVGDASDRIAYSGADLQAFIGNIQVGTLAAITVSVTREVMPIYTCGDPNPKCFVKGKRGIAGSMTFQQFNKHAVIEALIKPQLGMKTGTHQIAELLGVTRQDNKLTTSISDGALEKVASASNGVYTLNGTGNGLTNDAVAFAQIVALSRQFSYTDQLPPFNLTLAFANERGSTSWMAIQKVQFVNEGYGFTLDDLNNEIAVTYVATGVTPLTDESPIVG